MTAGSSANAYELGIGDNGLTTNGYLKMTKASFLVLLIALTSSGAFANPVGPQVPNPANPFPANPVATDGSKLPRHEMSQTAPPSAGSALGDAPDRNGDR
ncbi:hypothetical protein [Beijerinckia sp. L45]|uniref:hypothetical protein n=1 Tax=Beijerinckia sp. L45 TaxID=1641855 RepID=UPI00131D3449|nr:hypothetical protein [Beijerinckia sp. L45]